MILVGLVGKKGSGKSTATKKLIRFYGEGAREYAFADPIKDICCNLFGWDRASLEEYFFKESMMNPDGTLDPFCEKYGMTRREIIQKIGTECFRDTFSNSIWIDVTFQKIESDNPKAAIISDVRFLNEAEEIIRRGGTLLRVIGKHVNEDDHSSEKEVDEILKRFKVTPVDFIEGAL